MAVLNHPESPCRVWRNNVGGYYTPEGRYVEYGLVKGSADLIGLERILITEEMVGSIFARFLSIEMKTPRGRMRDEQKAWLQTIQTLGGTATVMRSPEEAETHVRRILDGYERPSS